jgi:hypothetical protein
MPVSTKPADAVQEQQLADVIRGVSKGMNALLKSGLNRKAIVVLLNDHTGIGKRDIDTVLRGLGQLELAYCK